MSSSIRTIKRLDVVIVKKCTETPKALPVKSKTRICNSLLEQTKFPLETGNDDGVLVMDHYLEVKTETMEEPEVIIEAIEERNLCFDNPFNIDLVYLKSKISLPVKDMKPLLYHETLLMCEGSGTSKNLNAIFPNVDEIQEIGSTCILCETLDDSGNILIFYTSQFTINNEVKTIEILSVVDWNFKLIHEKRVEKTCCHGQFTEKSLHIIAREDYYSGLKYKVENNVKESWKSEIRLNHTGSFLGYGGCFLLMRYLITNKCSGSFHFWSFDVEGEICLLEIEILEPTCMKINEIISEVQRVNHNFYFKSGKISQNKNYYHSKTGHLLKHSTTDSDCFMVLNPLSDVPPNNYIQNLHENWEQDIQLMSLFLDFKSKREKELEQLFKDSDLKFKTIDYLLCLAKNKPTNIMEFTMSFINKLEQKASRLQTLNAK